MAYDKFYVSSHPGSGSGLSFGFTVDGGIGGIVTYVLSGQILDSAGAGLDGVTITLSGDGEGTTETAGGGFFAIAVPDGNYTVTPTLGGGTFSPTSRAAVVDGANLNLSSMQQTWVISGAITGDEVEGVTITLTGDASDSTTSAADGTYSFTGLLDGDYTLTPTLAGYTFAPASTNVTIVAADQTGQDFVSSEITYTISGTITGDEDEGVTVALTGDATDSTTTAADGTYSFTGLDSGSYTVTPTLTDYTFAPADIDVTISGADDTDSDFVASYDFDLPKFVGFNSGDSTPSTGATEDFDLDVYTSLSLEDTVTVDGATPSDFSKSIQLIGGPSIAFGGLQYKGFKNRSLSFDKASGIRCVALMTNVGAENGYDARLQTNGYGIKIFDGSSGPETDALWLYPFMPYSDPDSLLNRQYLGGVQTQLDPPGARQWTGNVLNNNYFPWVAIGAEVGANLASITFRLKTFGNSEGVGAEYATAETLAVTAPSGDWSSVTFDSIEIVHSYGGVAGGGTTITSQIHWFWIGTASDDWPV